MVEVTVTGWVDGLNKIQLNHLLRQHAGFGLGDAKRAVDALLDGGSITCEFPDMESATMFCRSANAIGAVCSAAKIQSVSQGRAAVPPDA